jgi:hypothetical protein
MCQLETAPLAALLTVRGRWHDDLRRRVDVQGRAGMGGSRRSTAGMPMRPLLCHVTKCSSHHDGACGTGSAELHGLLHAGWHLRSGDRNEGELREIAFGAPVSRRPIPKPCTTEATATERSNAPPSYISSAAHPMMRPSTRATNAVSRWSSRPSTGSSASRSSCRIDGPSSAVALSMSTFIRVISGCEYVLMSSTSAHSTLSLQASVHG